jgi:hypothetical protein
MRLKISVLSGLLTLMSLFMTAPAQAATVIYDCTASSPSALTIVNPNADACAGFYSNNLFSASNAADQQAAINSLPGISGYVVNWSVLDPTYKIDAPATPFDFGVPLSGKVIIGAHWGNYPDTSPGTLGNVSVFWLWNNYTASSFPTLSNTGGWSDAVLYMNGGTCTNCGFDSPVPEPATWALMLLGFAFLGATMRSVRRKRRSELARA